MTPIKIMIPLYGGAALHEVEVLTVHFEACKMRIRYWAPLWKDPNGEPVVHTDDVDATPFFEQYTVMKYYEED